VQQRTSSGAWKTLSSGSIAQSSRGYAYAYWRYRGTGWIGHLLRVRATWAGNAADLSRPVAALDTECGSVVR
jgi:hypothetical protein